MNKLLALSVALLSFNLYGQDNDDGTFGADGNETSARPEQITPEQITPEPITPDPKPPAKPWPQVYSYILVFGTLAVVMRIYKYFKDKDSSPNGNDVNDDQDKAT